MKELKNFRRDERIQIHNLGSLCSDRSRGAGLITHHTSLITLKKVFFAKRTQSCSMFTGETEKTSACETHQNRCKTAQNRYETHSNEVKPPKLHPKMTHFTGPWTGMGTTPAPGVPNRSGSAGENIFFVKRSQTLPVIIEDL
jgi:hypothetical protein